MKQKSKRKATGVVSVALAAALLFSGCSSGTAATASAAGGQPSAPKALQSLTYVSTVDAIKLSPILWQDTSSNNVGTNIYESLFRADPKTGEIKPFLADSYTNPDVDTWIVKLKKNIKFQDGTPLTSAAVKYTFDKVRDPKTASPNASLLGPVDSIETPDDDTVVLKTKTPYGIMLTALASLSLAIVNPKADQAGDISRSPVNAGTGPFLFKEWVPGDHVTLVKNPNYWGGAPKLDSITFKVVPEVSTAVSMLQDGEADYMTGIPATQYDRLKSDSNINIITQRGNRLEYLSFNTQKKPYDDPRIRKAIEYAVDRDAYVKTLNGLGYRSNGDVGPEKLGYDEEVESHGYPYDLAKAKELMAEAGYPNGFKTTFTYGNNVAALISLAPFIQDQLKKIGIELTIENMDFAAAIQYKKAGKHELYLNGWSNGSGDGEEFLYPELHSASIGATNYSNWKDPESDSLIEKTRTTTDQKQRLEYIAQANIKFADDPVIIPLYFEMNSLASRNNVKGIVYSTSGDIDLRKAYKE